MPTVAAPRPAGYNPFPNATLDTGIVLEPAPQLETQPTIFNINLSNIPNGEQILVVSQAANGARTILFDGAKTAGQVIVQNEQTVTDVEARTFFLVQGGEGRLEQLEARRPNENRLTTDMQQFTDVWTPAVAGSRAAGINTDAVVTGKSAALRSALSTETGYIGVHRA